MPSYPENYPTRTTVKFGSPATSNQKVEGLYQALIAALVDKLDNPDRRDVEQQMGEYRAKLEAKMGDLTHDKFAAYLLGAGHNKLFETQSGYFFCLRDIGISLKELGFSGASTGVFSAKTQPGSFGNPPRGIA